MVKYYFFFDQDGNFNFNFHFMVNFKSSGFNKGTEGKSGKFQSYCGINITDSFSFSLYNMPFYTVFHSRAIANITEVNFIIQITQI